MRERNWRFFHHLIRSNRVITCNWTNSSMISMLLGISRIPNRPEASPLLRFLPPSLHAPYSSSPVAPNIRDSNAGVIPGPASVAEAKMERWLSQGGADNLSGPAYKGDRHKDAAAALGKGDDWTHSKILADNNIRLASVERRLELDKEWQVVKGKIQHSYRAKVRVARGFLDRSDSSSHTRYIHLVAPLRPAKIPTFPLPFVSVFPAPSVLPSFLHLALHESRRFNMGALDRPSELHVQEGQRGDNIRQPQIQRPLSSQALETVPLPGPAQGGHRRTKRTRVKRNDIPPLK